MSNLGTGVRSIWGIGGAAMDPYWRRVTGGDAVAHAVARRLITPRGHLLWAPEIGYDVRALLNLDYTESDLRIAEGYIVAECLADERVSRARVDFATDAARRSGTITVTLTTSDAESFALVFAASEMGTRMTIGTAV